jgi:hypothetical protein
MTKLSKGKEFEYDKAYSRIVEIESESVEDVDELRRMANDGHVLSMALLATWLSNIDSVKYREEIIKWNEKAHNLGCEIAAYNMSVQYMQWNEPFMSRLWYSRVPESERD